jgi:hypothetical protein
MAIAGFIADKMSAYIAGGMKPVTAAHFTRGELLAIYKGDHRSRDTSGAMRVTPPPEDIPIEAARAKCDEAIKEILKCRARDARKAPENAPAAQEKSGFEKMAEYARNPA